MQVKRSIFIFIMMIAVIFLQGCIEISEEITVNADGSGSFSCAVDIGAIGASVDKNNSQFDLSFLDKVKKMPAEAERLLEGMEGIKNLKTVQDDKKGIYSITLDFTDSRALNKAIYKVLGYKKTAFSPSFIKASKHKLVNKDISPYLRKALKGKQNEGYNNLVFSLINYTCTCRLPADVKKVSNIKAGRPDARTVITSYTLDDMMKGGFDFGNTIRY